MASVLYVFLDHSGELKFIPQSNRYFTLASLCTREPSGFAADYHALKYRLIAEAQDESWDTHRFHASEDPKWVREAFLAFVGERKDIRLDAVSIRKDCVPKQQQPPHVFYPRAAKLLLRQVLPQALGEQQAERIEFVLGQFPLKGLATETFVQKMSSQLGKLTGYVPFALRLHYSHAHPHLQAVDYCAWAVHRALENGDDGPARRLEGVIRTDWEYAPGEAPAAEGA